jgi:uncharacterized YccA/Bax inhibitor family protein
MAGNVFDEWAVADARSGGMTVRGTALKAVGLLVIVGVCAAIAWNQASNGTTNIGLLIGAAIGGFVLAILTAFKPAWAAITAPLYSACQGFVLGVISNLFNVRYPGIAQNAVGATLATAGVILLMYTTRMVRVTDGLTRFIVGATFALCAFYAVRFLLSMFGVNMMGTMDSSPLSIGISALAVGIASLNLLLDFDFIEKQSRAGAPKQLEWYGAFALMVTLIWLYFEILRLLAKLSDRR